MNVKFKYSIKMRIEEMLKKWKKEEIEYLMKLQIQKNDYSFINGRKYASSVRYCGDYYLGITYKNRNKEIVCKIMNRVLAREIDIISITKE